MIYNGEYVGGQDPRQPYISPLFGDFSGLPPMLFQVGGLEMLLSDSVVAAQKAREAGCEVILSVYEEMFHVFQMGMDKLTESKAAWEEVRRFLF
jgi:acetyl esterase/lipase